jgi:hypothetical protein
MCSESEILYYWNIKGTPLAAWYGIWWRDGRISPDALQDRVCRQIVEIQASEEEER